MIIRDIPNLIFAGLSHGRCFTTVIWITPVKLSSQEETERAWACMEEDETILEDTLFLVDFKDQQDVQYLFM